jgi:hypothetical protein
MATPDQTTTTTDNINNLASYQFITSLIERTHTEGYPIVECTNIEDFLAQVLRVKDPTRFQTTFLHLNGMTIAFHETGTDSREDGNLWGSLNGQVMLNWDTSTSHSYYVIHDFTGGIGFSPNSQALANHLFNLTNLTGKIILLLDDSIIAQIIGYYFRGKTHSSKALLKGDVALVQKPQGPAQKLKPIVWALNNLITHENKYREVESRIPVIDVDSVKFNQVEP